MPLLAMQPIAPTPPRPSAHRVALALRLTGEYLQPLEGLRFLRVLKTTGTRGWRVAVALSRILDDEAEEHEF